jgi:hypothetical protein
MYLPIFQALSDTSRNIFIEYSNRTFGSKSLDTLETAKNQLLSDIPSANNEQWLTSLHNEVKKHLSETIDASALKTSLPVPESILFSYLNKAELSYIGTGSNPMPRLEGLLRDGFDVNDPHMEWILRMDQKIEQILKNAPDVAERSVFGFVKDCYDLDISLDKYLSIRNEYSPSISQREIRPYIEWFLRSEKNFDRGELSLDAMHKISTDIKLHGNPSPIPVGVIYQIYKTMDIHPLHEKEVCYWANSVSRVQRKEFSVDESSFSPV